MNIRPLITGVAVFSIVALIIASGCTNAKSANNSASSNSATTTETTAQITPTAKPADEPQIMKFGTYEISDESYKDEEHKVKFSYLKISNYYLPDKEDAINVKLAKINEYFQRDNKTHDRLDALEFYTGSSQIKLGTPHILSIYSTNMAFWKPAAHESRMWWTFTFDMDTGEEIDLHRLIKQNDDFLKLYMSDKCKPLYDFMGEYKKSTTLDNLKKSNIYLTSESFIFLIPASLGKAADWEYEIKFKDIPIELRNPDPLWDKIETSMNQDIKNMISVGSVPDALQSYWTNFENWGKVYFMTTIKREPGNAVKADFYLEDMDKTLYKLADFYNGTYKLTGIKAVSFSDVNRDGLTDVILVAGKDNGGMDESVAGIYLQKGKAFIFDTALSDKINVAKKNESISAVLEYLGSL